MMIIYVSHSRQSYKDDFKKEKEKIVKWFSINQQQTHNGIADEMREKKLGNFNELK